MIHTSAAPAPTRFVDAEQVSPYRVLIDLRDHALFRGVSPDVGHALAELALAAAVAHNGSSPGWSMWPPPLARMAGSRTSSHCTGPG